MNGKKKRKKREYAEKNISGPNTETPQIYNN